MTICPTSSVEGGDLTGPQQIVAAHKQGNRVGLASICSAHPFVLEAAVRQAVQDGSPLLIESTSNQVNQSGGYTGMTPAGFHDHVWSLATRWGLPGGRLILGGDHLGPYPWRHKPAGRAMDWARTLIRECVLAGYTKLHLDTSVQCSDDAPDRPLDPRVAASRTAELCLAAEEALRVARPGQPAPSYVVGAEVPVPGGTRGHGEEPALTRAEDAQEAIELTRAAFLKHGLEAAWERVIALVVQPGVEFSEDEVTEYDRLKAAPLSHFIETHDRLVYEVHSTDYQRPEVLRALVEDHFAILKVGPALTFAFREAVFALAQIEAEWLEGCLDAELSNLRAVLEGAMLARPQYWRDYYTGSPDRLRFVRAYSLSDRVRYYWPDPGVQTALARLLSNLEWNPIPLTLLSQFLPEQHKRVLAGSLANRPRDLIDAKIRSVIADYARACGYG